MQNLIVSKYLSRIRSWGDIMPLPKELVSNLERACGNLGGQYTGQDQDAEVALCSLGDDRTLMLDNFGSDPTLVFSSGADLTEPSDDSAMSEVDEYFELDQVETISFDAEQNQLVAFSEGSSLRVDNTAGAESLPVSPE